MRAIPWSIVSLTTLPLFLLSCGSDVSDALERSESADVLELNGTVYDAERIRFDHGAIGATYEGRIEAGGVTVYVFDAVAGVKTLVKITSVTGIADFDIFASSGTQISGSATEDHVLSDTRGDHHIVVSSSGGDAEYQLVVLVEP